MAMRGHVYTGPAWGAVVVFALAVAFYLAIV